MTECAMRKSRELKKQRPEAWRDASLKHSRWARLSFSDSHLWVKRKAYPANLGPRPEPMFIRLLRS